jgi:uncharacterized membrane protein YdfJ with MMPL/SSD domain
MVAATIVLLVLAVPALDLELGQNDVGALSEATTARKAYDLLSEGFGPGQNGPLLIATKLGTPAANDQKKLDDLNKKAKDAKDKQQGQVKQLTQEGLAKGLPPAEAQSQAEAGPEVGAEQV